MLFAQLVSDASVVAISLCALALANMQSAQKARQAAVVPYRVLKRIELWKEAKERSKAMRDLSAETQLAVRLALQGVLPPLGLSAECRPENPLLNRLVVVDFQLVLSHAFQFTAASLLRRCLACSAV